ncbi:MAG: hypothetical protein U0746_20635 [Gemmataceae bacterium]
MRLHEVYLTPFVLTPYVWVSTTVKGDKQKKGVTIVEIKPDGTHADGWSVGDHGVGGERWSAFSGTSAKPVKPSGKKGS